MDAKPTYQDLEKRIKELEAESIKDRQACEELHRLALVIQNSRDIINLSTPDGKMVFLNDTGKKMLGLSEAEVDHAYIRDVIPEHLYENMRQEVLTAVDRDGYWEGDIQYRNIKTGDLKDMHGIAYKITDPKTGMLQFLANYLQDVTGQKRADEEKKLLKERLDRAEKMEAIGVLAGGVAHDLNNILGALVAFSELLVEKLPQDSSLGHYASNIMQSSLKGAAIIQDLLTLAKSGVILSEVVNLNGIISDYLGSPEFGKLKCYHLSIKIQADLEEELLNIKGVSQQLSKMVMNLVLNAMESISDRGEVTIKTENRYLDHPISGYDEMQEGDYVVLLVSDTGDAISAKDMDKIFEPFYTKRVMGRSGTGLGLAAVWGTVRAHHGYIDVKSEEGKGSTFTLYFPITREEPQIGEKPVFPLSFAGRGETILVVDDVPMQRELAVSMLERLGYSVESVASGEEAIAYAKNKKVDLVVLDMIMDPGIDGMETYQKILEIHPGQKAVIVSGYSETDRVSQAQKMGAGSFVRKPYILAKIGLAVRRELDRT
jgi:two-component system, cell cycle sensor histidine kinase and response regulator CckA